MKPFKSFSQTMPTGFYYWSGLFSTIEEAELSLIADSEFGDVSTWELSQAKIVPYRILPDLPVSYYTALPE